MIVSDIMSRPVVVTQKNKSLEHIKELFFKKNINAIPVLSMEGEIEGIVTTSDLRKETDFTKLVADVMTSKTHVVGIQSGVHDAAKMMQKHHVHHLVVMDNGQVVGIISAMDFVSIVAQG